MARGHEPADALVDELLPLLMAAQEPPAIAVAWVLDRLGREPDPAAGLLDGSADDAFVRETLRLRPPAMAALRRLTEPREVAGHRLPAGVTVMMPTVPLHRDPAAFLDADAFRPERWTHDSPAFLPFGGGERRCLGEHLAHAYFGGLLPALAGRTRPVRPEPERMVLRDRAGPAPQRARQSRETSLKNVLSSPLAFSSW